MKAMKATAAEMADIKLASESWKALILTGVLSTRQETATASGEALSSSALARANRQPGSGMQAFGGHR